MKPHIYIFFLLIGLMTSAYGQEYSTSNKKAVKLYEKAVTSIQQSNNIEALNLLEQALKEDNGFIEAHLVLADLMSDIDRIENEEQMMQNVGNSYRNEAKQHYRAVVERQSDFFTPAWVSLGKLELYDRNYDEAIKCFETYLQLDKRQNETMADAQQCLKKATFRREALAHPVPFDPQNLGPAINSKDDEYLPALTADGEMLVFTRRFPRKASTTAATNKEEDLYMSLSNNGQWGVATRMPEPLNSNDNEGAECISQDGRIMFFTACGRNDGGGRCDIYMCVNKGGTWGKPRNLGPSVNSGAWEGQPTFSIDGKTLYFVSNRKGGYGGMDIWKTVFENGKWTEPVNLGPEINSEYDEMSPFIHFDDRTLYFSSNRPEGMGGFDLYVSNLEHNSGQWSKPNNLGYPINTEGDDNNLIVSADGKTAIYASDRQGGYGKMDLYRFEMPEHVRPTVAICFKGTVTDAKTSRKMAADIKVVDILSGRIVANTSSDAQSGQYIVSLPADGVYAFHVSADGYLLHSQSEVWKQEDSGYNAWKPVIVDIALHPIEVGERIALNNVFFETGRWEILDGSEYELAKIVELLKQNPTLRIELGGHTDNVGGSEFNQKLSGQRAKAVYDWLIAHGTASERLTYKGYGETQPVASNDTEEGRSKNRRTEIKVM